jgi:hypothetical protein
VGLNGHISAEDFVSNAVAKTFAALLETINIPNETLNITEVSAPNIATNLCIHFLSMSRNRANSTLFEKIKQASLYNSGISLPRCIPSH